MVKKKGFRIRVTVRKGRKTSKQLRVASDVATLFASSPFLTRKQKRKEIRALFR